MTYTPPTTEQLFVLDHIAHIGVLAEHERFADATPDMVEAIVTGIGEFAAEVYAPLNRVGDVNNPKWQDGKVTMPPGFKDAYKAFVEAGWGSIDGPVDYGGQGLPFTLATVVIEALGSADMGFTLCNILTPGAIHALMAYGTEEQRRTWLPKLVSGEWNGTMNLTEPAAGSDVGALRSTAEKVTEGEHAGLYRIKGQKIFITFGEHDLTDNIVHLVLARTPGAPEGTRGISLFLVPKYRLDAEGKPTLSNGVHCASIEHKLGIHGSPTAVMVYGEAEDCLGEIVGDEMGGMRAMFVMMNNARLMVGCQGVQVAERATQQAQSFAAERVQSSLAGSPDRTPVTIDQHPDVRRMLWRMRAQTEAARALVYYAAAQTDLGKLGDENAAMRAEILIPLVKAHATDIGCEVASLGIQVHGGMGFIEETGAAQHYRDARIAPIYEGTNGIQAADLVGRKLGMAGGDLVRGLIDDIANGAGDFPELQQLVDACRAVTDWMVNAPTGDRLAGSYPYLTMLATATCGWLMALQHKGAKAMLDAGEGDAAFLAAKIASTRFYLQQIVPAATGLAPSALAGDAALPALG
ncbi:acyl-CoA dehydrogenase [Sphingopyxis sp. YF1]|uniref:acyl-CoA dehydrogenase n=1 Tax=Sphingopyxis sp. YF1 TaxID=2482763 RepID=UPI001F626295|nr:acyl-CoA dehydrogenase [Sphingopyxis sp. YF1]UNU44849.1 acyl-CoA dehydrogenase [Sphingopyxis sp. YF1]